MIVSPCVGICRLDGRTGLCDGCGRDASEIEAWPTMTDEERRALLARLAESRDERPAASQL